MPLKSNPKRSPKQKKSSATTEESPKSSESAPLTPSISSKSPLLTTEATQQSIASTTEKEPVKPSITETKEPEKPLTTEKETEHYVNIDHLKSQDKPTLDNAIKILEAHLDNITSSENKLITTPTNELSVKNTKLKVNGAEISIADMTADLVNVSKNENPKILKLDNKTINFGDQITFVKNDLKTDVELCNSLFRFAITMPKYALNQFTGSKSLSVEQKRQLIVLLQDFIAMTLNKLVEFIGIYKVYTNKMAQMVYDALFVFNHLTRKKAELVGSSIDEVIGLVNEVYGLIDTNKKQLEEYIKKNKSLPQEQKKDYSDLIKKLTDRKTSLLKSQNELTEHAKEPHASVTSTIKTFYKEK